jgi:hypothetical protein
MARVPPYSPQGPRNKSGIEVEHKLQDYGVTATVLLSRSGMGMMQRKQADDPPIPAPADAAANIIYSVATDSDIGCPKCRARFEVSQEFFGAVAECPECGCEFLIKPPGTAPYRPPKPRARRPAPPQRLAPPTAHSPSTPYRRPPAQSRAPEPEREPEEIDDDEYEDVAVSSGRDPLIVGLLIFLCVLVVVLIVVLAK